MLIATYLRDVGENADVRFKNSIQPTLHGRHTASFNKVLAVGPLGGYGYFFRDGISA